MSGVCWLEVFSILSSSFVGWCTGSKDGNRCSGRGALNNATNLSALFNKVDWAPG